MLVEASPAWTGHPVRLKHVTNAVAPCGSNRGHGRTEKNQGDDGLVGPSQRPTTERMRGQLAGFYAVLLPYTIDDVRIFVMIPRVNERVARSRSKTDQPRTDPCRGCRRLRPPTERGNVALNVHNGAQKAMKQAD